MKQNKICTIIDLSSQYEALSPLTKQRTVGSLPFGGRYRLIDFPLSAISNAGIKEVGIFSPPSDRSLQDHIRSGKPWDLDSITGGVFTYPFIEEDSKDKNKQWQYYQDLLTFLKKSGSTFTLLTSAHSVSNLNIAELLSYHIVNNNPITTVYKRQEVKYVSPNEEALNISENSDVTAIMDVETLMKGPHEDVLPMFMNIAMLRTSLLIELIQNAAKQSEFKSLPSIMREAVEVYNANAYEYTGFYANINTVKRYFDTNMAMVHEEDSQALFFSSHPIYTRNKNEIPTFFSKASEVKSSLLGTGGRIEGRVENSIVFRRSVVNRYASVDHSILMQESKVGRGTTLKYVILDKNVVIGANLKIEGTPEKPIVFPKGTSVFRKEDIAKGVQK
ncbi:glucose-1-phosphate adenylyltransferase subunit GlgD [Ligilactobacillus acidipiscis]|uniref:glucose-1-phosphate adenylyltransferase subunit GlgD n=1 Tax=Ligilactobacillus acidipiscis TaxID=89059 RepID=UPI0023F7EE3F|nr:glucose-1-phosphate adenylyltransferase subunit GlgD [Ligilactobacillus acidipiscis]WEV57084.1 glucose-1-phosphate adenylyltransferase subunit GlgD [Ligilactobacillus acidipiscis]